MAHRNNKQHHPQQQTATGYQNQQFSPKDKQKHQHKHQDSEQESEAAPVLSQSHAMGYFHGMPTQPEKPKYVRESLLLSNRMF